MRDAICLVLSISMTACTTASTLPNILATDCACGEVWRTALLRERLAWDVERTRLESELAAL